ncbi:MAG: PAS domain S-box protein [Deltaproteobacteria bacterium]|nr:PAS domain S-box protein [Deltaproteobacteria bacterium]
MPKVPENASNPFPGGEDFPLLSVAIIGGGRACHDLLKNVHEGRLNRLNITIIGVSSHNEKAPGYLYAKRLGLFTTTNYRDLYSLKGLNVIVELTGSEKLTEDILRSKPPGVSLIDHRSARILWVPLLKEAAESDLETLLLYHKRKEAHTQTILDSLPYRIMVVNRDKTISMVNQTFLREKNLSYDDVIGKHCYEVRYELDRPCSDYGQPCYMEEVEKKGQFISTTHEYVNRDGEIRYDVITVSPIMDDRGNIVQILEASRDITERIQYQKEAQKTAVFLENVIESTVDGIVVVDTKGNVLIFNEGMEKLTGYTAEEIMEKGHLSSFYNMDVAKENMLKMRSDTRGPLGKLNPTSMSITNKSGEEIPVTLSASLITIDGREVGSVGIFTDMRELLLMRKELEEARIQLFQSEKIASVGRMAAGVAHEINNPLSGILIYAELLKESLKDHLQHTKDLQEIIDQTLRTKRIVSDLLEFSRQSIGKTTAFSLEELIDKCLNLLMHQATFQDIDVVREVEADMPQMVGDMGQLQQVFTNLFINAADAMEGKGRLGISVRYDRGTSRFMARVSDTGPGIPEQFRNKVFDIFFTTKPVGKGTGLGLSISQKIIELHGGAIHFECPPQGGTAFLLELPLEKTGPALQDPLFIGMDA